jgi:hypothetical protein
MATQRLSNSNDIVANSVKLVSSGGLVDVGNYEDLQLQIQDEEVKPEPIQEVKVVKKRQPSV